MKAIDIILLLLIAAALFFAVRSKLKHRGCSCGCENCPSKGKCK